jgi:hypothetical protein
MANPGGASSPSVVEELVDAERTSWWDRPLPVAVAMVGWFTIAAIAAVLLRRAGVPTLNDLGQPLRAAMALRDGSLDKVLWEAGSFAYTSPPGWPALIWAVASTSSTTLVWANIWLGWVAWSALLVAATVCAHAAGIVLRSVRGLVTVAAVAASSGSAAALAEFWHPQDLAGTAGVLLGVAAALRRYWVWAGVAFGVAIAIRHPMALALLPLVVLAPTRRARLSLLIGAVAIPVLVSWPFFAAQPIGFIEALRGETIMAVPVTPAGRVLSSLHGSFAVWGVGRLAPIAAAVAVAAVVWWRRSSLTPSAPVLLGACGAVFASRLVFEPAPFIYYAAPAAVFAILAGPARGRWPFMGLGGVWVLAAAGGTGVLRTVADDPLAARSVGATVCWTLGTALLFVALGRWWAPSSGLGAGVAVDADIEHPEALGEMPGPQ